MYRFKIGDRVTFVYACPTAPPIHKDYVGLTGTVEQIDPHIPTIKNVYGQDIPNPSGNVKVKLDERFYGDGYNCGVIWVFSFELKLES